MTGTPQERALLSLDGLSLGDAFGQTFVTEEPLRLVRERRLADAPWPWTDDTAMALSLLETLAAFEFVNQNDLARRFTERYAREPGRGYGPGTRRSSATSPPATTGARRRRGLQRGLTLSPGTPIEHVMQALDSGAIMAAQDTVPLALWCAAHHLTDYESALWLTVGALGDRDTTCSIAGGIVACRVGRDGLPAQWLARREPPPTLSLS